MPQSTDPATDERPVMRVGPGVMVRGDIDGATDLHVDGRVVGKVRVEGLVVGEHGLIDGPVTAGDALIGGCVIGRVDARALRLSATARVEGDVACDSLQIEAGARLAGRCVAKEPHADKVVPLFRDLADGPGMGDAAQELLKLAARLRRLRE